MSDTQETQEGSETYESSDNTSAAPVNSDDLTDDEQEHRWFPLSVYVGQWTEHDRYDMMTFSDETSADDDSDHDDDYRVNLPVDWHHIARSFFDNIKAMFDIVISDNESFGSMNDYVYMSVLEVSDHRTRNMLQVVEPQGEGDGSVSFYYYRGEERERISRGFLTYERLTLAVKRCFEAADADASLIVSLYVPCESEDYLLDHTWHCETMFLRGNDSGSIIVDSLLNIEAIYISRVTVDHDDGLEYNRSAMLHEYLLANTKRLYYLSFDAPIVHYYVDKHDYDKVGLYEEDEDEEPQTLHSAMRSDIDLYEIGDIVRVYRADRD